MSVTLIQQATATANSGTTFTLTTPTPPVDGDVEILTVYIGSGIGVAVSVTQVGAVWNQISTEINGGITIFLFAAVGISAASNNIVINVTGGSSSYAANFAEFAIPGFMGTIDQHAVNFGNTTTVDSGTIITPAYADELWIALLTATTLGIGAPSNGFTVINSATTSTPGSEQTAQLDYKVVSAVASANTSATFVPGLADEWTGAIFALVLPVAPPPPPPPACITPSIHTPLITVQNYLDELRERFAEINFVTWLSDSDLVAWMNLGVDDIAYRTLPPRYEVYPPYQINSVGGQVNYTLPADFFRLKEFGDTSGLFFNGDALLFEDKTAEMEQFQFGIGFMPTNQPIWFWFWSKQFFVYPPPADNTGIIKMYYYRLPIAVSSTCDIVDVDRPWTEVLIKFVLWKALEKDKHPMSQIYRQQYEQALSNQYSESRIRVEKRARYVHSHDYWGREDR